jgi:N-acyl-D-amino-acid deacylase
VHDLLLRGGTVFDGLGVAGPTADVAIGGGVVAAVGTGLGRARRVLDVVGLAVAPGFVDPHTHSDMVPLTGEAHPVKLLQGVTTEVVGNCGVSFAPLDTEAAAALETVYGDLTRGLRLVPRTFAEYLDHVWGFPR